VPLLHRHYPTSTLLHTPPPSSTAGVYSLRNHRCPLPMDTARTSLVAHLISPMRAIITTPVGFIRHIAYFRINSGLPRYYGGSAPTTTFRGLLNVHSRYGPHGPLISQRDLFLKCFSSFVTSCAASSVSGRSENYRVGFAPTNQMHLSKAHTITRWKTV
jgi:hypothetical protein